MFEEIAIKETTLKETAGLTRDEPPSTVLGQADAIAVRRNVDGDIVIRQRHPMASDDPQIVVPLQEAGNLIEAIRREMQAAAE